MAKKKKVTKKVVKKAPVELTEAEQAMDDAIDEMSDEDVDEVIDASKIIKPESKVADAGSDGKRKLKKVNIPVHIKYNGKNYAPGVHIFEDHQVPQILEMVDKKKKADLSMFTGKNYLIERLLNRVVVREVDDIDLKKLAK